MQSTALTVNEYLQEVPAERKPALERLRGLCQVLLPEHTECMRYGMACYERDGQVEAAFASQKNFIALYITKLEVMDAHRSLLTGRGISIGKGCIRYSQPERIDFAVVESLLKATRESCGKTC